MIYDLPRHFGRGDTIVWPRSERRARWEDGQVWLSNNGLRRTILVSAVQPIVELSAVCEYAAALFARNTMNGQTPLAFPALSGAHVAADISGDCLPRIEPVTLGVRIPRATCHRYRPRNTPKSAFVVFCRASSPAPCSFVTLYSLTDLVRRPTASWAMAFGDVNQRINRNPGAQFGVPEAMRLDRCGR
jgi:hypothetical protein